MKYISNSYQVIFSIVIALTMCSQSFCKENETNEEIAYKSYIQEFHSAFGKQMEKEFNLKWIEKDFPFDFSSKAIKFYASRRATLEEARALELSILNKLAEAIWVDPKMLSFLNKLSLDPESIGINIHFVNSENMGYDDGSIDNVYSIYSEKDENEFQKRYLNYTITDPFKDYSAEDEAFNTRFEESFEEAVKLNAVTTPITNPTIHAPTGFEDELNRILASFEEEMNEKHSLRFWSSGWMMAGKSTSDIDEIRTKCMYRYPVSHQEARALMLLTAEKLLTSLNNSETLRPYLKEYPFTANRLKLRMLFRKNKLFVGDAPYYDGSMESTVLSGNMITYYHHIINTDDSRMYDRVVYAIESYQEAQKAFKKTPSQTIFEKIAKGIKNFIFNFNDYVELTICIFCIFFLFIINPVWVFVIFFIIGLIFLLCSRHSPSQQD